MRPFVILEAPFENGIAMMQRMRRGVLGTAAAPAAIAALLPPDWPRRSVNLAPYRFRVMPATRDAPAAIVRDNLLTIAGHAALTEAAAAATADGLLPITIGGDHSITWPLLRGVARGRRLGVIYIDAHLDMRPLESHAGVDGLISSGNSFRRILEDATCGVAGRNMVAIGVQRSNTPLFTAMLTDAQTAGVTVVWLSACAGNLQTLVDDALRLAGSATDGIYLSLDIDAVRESDAPGVSAPAAAGLSRAQWLTLAGALAARAGGDDAGGARLVGVDIVETSARTLGWQRLFDSGPAAYEPPRAYADDVLTPTAALAAETLRAVVAPLL